MSGTSRQVGVVAPEESDGVVAAALDETAENPPVTEFALAREFPEADAPEAGASAALDPEAVNAAAATAAESDVSESDGDPAAPDAEPYASDAATGDVPEPDVPEPDVPEPDVPEADAPEADAPEADAPEADAPEADAPEPDAPEPEPSVFAAPATAAFQAAAPPTPVEPPEPPPAPIELSGPPSERLRQLGIELPAVAPPAGDYVPAVRVGDLIFTAGQLPMIEGSLQLTGVVGDEPVDISVSQARALARICAVNALAAIAQHTDLDQVARIVKVVGFVASAPGFTQQPAVIDGASELFGQLWGDAGRHARSAVGVIALPRNAPVEVEVVVALVGDPASATS